MFPKEYDSFQNILNTSNSTTGIRNGKFKIKSSPEESPNSRPDREKNSWDNGPQSK